MFKGRYTERDGIRYCSKHPDIALVYYGVYNNQRHYQCPACNLSRRERHKNEVFEALGNQCTRCGIDDTRVLQVDHVHGTGFVDRNKFGNGSVVSLVSQSVTYRDYFYAHLDEYQLLCANCHILKTREAGDYRKNHTGRPRKSSIIETS